MLALILAATVVTGPSSSQSPYVVPVAPNVQTISILTTGDVVTGYRMSPIPDGLGAFDNGDGTFTLLMNHELLASVDVRRAHGGIGATISRWTIRKSDLAVLDGRDLVHTVYRWRPETGTYEVDRGFSFNRLCSATLGEVSASYDAATNTGYPARLFFNGEEVGPTGRAFAHTLDGESFDLPRLGRASWENQVPHNGTGLKTVVIGLDDNPSGQLYVYIGTKTNSGSAIDRAGLTNGRLYGVKVPGFPIETDQGIQTARFELHDLGDVSLTDGNKLQDESIAAGITAWQRPEDGAWDPLRPRDFYFATTGVSAVSRLWRLRFDDVDELTRGGTVTMMFDQTAGPIFMDNITIATTGTLYVQEDAGGRPHLSGIWRYDLSIPAAGPTLIARHDPVRFGEGGTMTMDDESSGIIDMTEILGPGWLLFTSQVRLPGHADATHGGQLLAAQVTGRRRAVGR